VTDQHTNPVSPTHQPPKPGITKSFFFLSIALVAIVAFIAGTRGNEILGALAPVFGFKVETSTIDLSSVEKTYQALKGNYDGKLDTQAMIDGANKGLVAAAGDKYTLYMNAKDAQGFNNDLSGDIGGGIGAEIGLRSNKPTIIRVLDGNPAAKAGLMAGDVLMKVNDQDVSSWTVDKVVDVIRGEVGTTVKVQVLRGSDTKEFTITRAEVTNPSVESSVKDGIGTLTISRFDDQTATLATKAAQSFKDQGVKGVVLDLRDDGGGYLTAAQAVAGLWIDNKVVVSERTNGKTTDELKSSSDPILKGIPTVVLVNGGTASASEIVSGALQDYGIAQLVGEKTYGKGSVQKIIPLANGAQLKVTVARWYTPKGKNINEEGITPDKIVGLTADDVNAGRDPQMSAALQLLASE